MEIWLLYKYGVSFQIEKDFDVSYPETGKKLIANWDAIKKILIKFILSEKLKAVEESSGKFNV